MSLLRLRRRARLSEARVEEPDFGERPYYLEEYVESFSRQHGRAPEVVDRIPPSMKNAREFNIIYPVGFGIFIHVYDDKESATGYNRYVVIEPPRPDPRLVRTVEYLLATVITEEEVPRSSEDKKRILLAALDRAVSPVDGEVSYDSPRVVRGRVRVSRRDLDLLKYYLVRDKVGVGVLEPFLRDPYLEDVSCNGVGPIYVVHKMFGPLEASVGFSSEEELDDFILRLGERIGKPISHARPVIDATLPDGSRINIVYGSDVSLKGSNFTIRRVSKVPVSVTQLINWGTFDSRIAAYMWILLEEGMSVFICGETASGKTTSLNAISVFIKPSAKIVTIEDTAEVTLPHPNWTRELTRDTGKPETSVTMFDLLRAALRQRPNYIIVGEIRGAEGNIAFQAMQSVAWETPVAVMGPDGRPRLTAIGEFVDAFYGEGEEGWPRPVEGYRILSLDGRGRLVWAPVSYVLRHRASEIYEIEDEDGGVVRATGSHSVFVLDEDELVARPALVSDLRPGDLLVSASWAGPRAGPPGPRGEGGYQRDGGSPGVEYSGPITLNPGCGEPVVVEVEDSRLGVARRLLAYEGLSHREAAAIAWGARLSGLEARIAWRGGSYRVLVGRPGPWSFRVPLAPLARIAGRRGIYESLPPRYRALVRLFSEGRARLVSRATAARMLRYIASRLEGLDPGEAVILARMRALIESDIRVVPVRSVRRTPYDGYVYDVSVPGTELFLGGLSPVALHNTGHPVMATFHAANLDRLLQRLTNHPINVPKTNIDSLNIAWFQSAVYVKGFPARRVIEINEIIGYDPASNAIAAVPVFTWDPVRDRFVFSGRGASYLLEEKIAVMKGIPRSRISEIYEELELRRRFLDLLVEKKVFDYFDVYKAIVKAYRLGVEEAVRRLERGGLL